MENRITGKSPLPITDESITIEENIPAQELCAEVGRLTAEVREALLQQALAVSNEKCNNLISRLNALTEDLTQQVKNVRSSVNGLEWNLKEENDILLKKMKQQAEKASESLREKVQELKNLSIQIQAEVSTATAKATDKASEIFVKRFNEVAEKALQKIDEQANEIQKKVNAASKEIDGVKDDIHFERGFRKFMFWATPVLLLVQTIITAFLLLK